jgi:uncharacterized protein YggE
MSTARGDAVKQARTKANELAKAAGLQLGDVQSISDASAPIAVPLAASPIARAPSVPVQPGTESLTVDVTVVFAIQ